MPMYEYRCRACGHTFDRLRAAAEADQAAPCDCGSTDTARLVSMIARRSAGAAGAALPMAGGSAPAPSGGGGGCCGGGCCS